MKKKYQQGILTIDFLFSTVIVYAVSMVFATMAITLMFSSVTQYILFSSARSKASAHISLDQQEQMAERKFDELVRDKLANFFVDNDWFELRQTNFHVDEPDTFNPTRGRRFYGTSVTYISKVLDFRVPLVGRTSQGLDSDEFGAEMSAFIYREPTTNECINFNSERWRVISGQFPELNGSFNINPNEAHGTQSDNGC